MNQNPELNPKISVITPSFNQGGYLEQCLRSVADQNYPNVEHIVFDGGSTDESVAVLRRSGNRIRWRSERDKNQCDAINKGLREASGDIVTWINSDDWLARGALRAVADFFRDHPEADFVYGNNFFTDLEGRVIRRFRTLPFRRDWLLFTKLLIPQPGCFVRRHVVEDCGLLDLSLPYVMDYEWWLRFTSRNRHPVFLDRYLAYFRFQPESKTCRRELVETIFREKRSVCEKYEPRARKAWWFMAASYQACIGKRLARWRRDLLHPHRSSLFCVPRPALLVNSLTPETVDFVNALDGQLDWEPRLWLLQSPGALASKLRLPHRVVGPNELRQALWLDRPDAVIVASDFSTASQASLYCKLTGSALLSWGDSEPACHGVRDTVPGNASAEDFHRAVFQTLATSRRQR